MFIHIGNSNVIRSREIILIVDYGVIKSSSVMDKMIFVRKKEGKVINSTSVVKSIVITNNLIYFSSLSVPTLKKRSSIFSMINKFENHSKLEDEL